MKVKISMQLFVMAWAVLSTALACGRGESQSPFHAYIEDTYGRDMAEIFTRHAVLRDIRREDLKAIGCNEYAVSSGGQKFLRKSCSFHLFGQDMIFGMSLNEFATRLWLPKWLKRTNYSLVGKPIGEPPITFNPGNSIIVLRLEDFPPAGAAIYFRVSEEIDSGSFYNIITGNRRTEIQVLEAVLLIETGVK